MKKVLIAVSAVLLVGALYAAFKIVTNQNEGPVTFLDYPYRLNNKVDTIEVTYVAWACACANWLPTNFLENPGFDTTDNAKNCIFLEADRSELIIPDEYRVGGNNNRIRLIGSFYTDEGISRDYNKPTSQKPEKAKVFRYTYAELIKPYTVWDFSEKEPVRRIIEEGEKSIFE